MKILLSKRAYAAALALLFIFMLALNFLTPYQADDFAYHFSFDTGERIESISDIFPSLAAHTQTMNGRLIAHFFVHLFELLPKAVFNVINSAVSSVLLLLICHFVSCDLPRSRPLILLLSFFAVWVFTPAFGEVMLWLDGSINYLWAIVLNLVFLLPYCRLFIDGKSIKNPLLGLGLVLFAFICGAFQETMSTASFLAALAFILAVRFYEKRTVGIYYILGVIASFAGLLFMALQPAESAVKSSSVSFVTFYHSFLNVMGYFKFFWLLIALFILSFALCSFSKVNKKRLILAGIFFLGFLCANGVMLLAKIYPARCASPAAIFLIISDGMLLNWLFELNYKKAVSGILLLLCAAALFWGITGTGDIVSTFAQFKANEAKMIQASIDGTPELYLPGLYGCTRYSIAYEMPFPSPIDWVNSYMGQYYGVERIIGYDFYTDVFQDVKYLN